MCVCAITCVYIHANKLCYEQWQATYLMKQLAFVYTHSVMYHSTTHHSSHTEVKSTLVHKVSHHWEFTTWNCPVKACLTFIIHLKLPVAKEGQQVLDMLEGSTKGSTVKGSDWTLCTWLVSSVEWCIRLWVPLPSVTHLCFVEHICTVCQQQFQHRELALFCGD